MFGNSSEAERNRWDGNETDPATCAALTDFAALAFTVTVTVKALEAAFEPKGVSLFPFGSNMR